MRKDGWRNLLIAHLSRVVRQPFEMGQHDCALFAAGCVEAMTGADYAADFRGRYKTMKGGIRVLRKAGFEDHIALAASHFDEIAPAFAGEGDLAAVDTPDGLALGVVQGAGVYVLGLDGLGVVSRLQAVRAFRVI